jgi:hypothetical protein
VRSRGGSGIPAVGVQEGGEEVARKLPRVDVVLVVSSVRAKWGRCGRAAAVDKTAGAVF